MYTLYCDIYIILWCIRYIVIYIYHIVMCVSYCDIYYIVIPILWCMCYIVIYVLYCGIFIILRYIMISIILWHLYCIVTYTLYCDVHCDLYYIVMHILWCIHYIVMWYTCYIMICMLYCDLYYIVMYVLYGDICIILWCMYYIVIYCIMIYIVSWYNPTDFSLLKCAIQWFLVHSRSCETITTMSFWNNLMPWKEAFSSPPSPSPLGSLVYFLPPWICLFWTFHVNGAIPRVSSVTGLFPSPPSARASHFSCIWLWLMGCNPPGSSVRGTLQQEHWSGCRFLLQVLPPWRPLCRSWSPPPQCWSFLAPAGLWPQRVCLPSSTAPGLCQPWLLVLRSWNCLQMESHVFPRLRNQSSCACRLVREIHCFMYIVCGFMVVYGWRLSPKSERCFYRMNIDLHHRWHVLASAPLKSCMRCRGPTSGASLTFGMVSPGIVGVLSATPIALVLLCSMSVFSMWFLRGHKICDPPCPSSIHRTWSRA